MHLDTELAISVAYVEVLALIDEILHSFADKLFFDRRGHVL